MSRHENWLFSNMMSQRGISKDSAQQRADFQGYFSSAEGQFWPLRFGSRLRACILAVSKRIPMQIIVLITRSIQKDANTVLLDPQLILTVLDESAT